MTARGGREEKFTMEYYVDQWEGRLEVANRRVVRQKNEKGEEVLAFR